MLDLSDLFDKTGSDHSPDFGCWWRWQAFRSRDLDHVLSDLFELQPFQVGRHITVVVKRSLNLIQQLGGHRPDRDTSSSVFFFCQNTFTFTVDMCNGEPNVEMLAGFEKIFEG